MKKLCLIIATCILCAWTVSAQNSGNKFEVGVGCAPFITHYMTRDGGANVPFEIATFFEWRRNLGKHFDYGARIHYKIGPYSQSLPTRMYNGLENNLTLTANADFWLVRGLFLGIEVGPSFDLMTSDSGYGPYTSLAFGAGPRIGIEFTHLRIYLDSFVSVFGSTVYGVEPICLNVGWTF